MLPFTRLLLVLGGLFCATTALAADPLPGWNEGTRKAAIVDFVTRVTTEGGADFVPVAERIAVFDNDGTLWCEQPVYFQLAFAVDRVKVLAAQHPEWQEKPALKAAIAGDWPALLKTGKEGLIEVVLVTHTNLTTDEFATAVKDWLKTADHPQYKRPYTECVFQPMLELLTYLRAHQFKTYIVSGGTVEFMRVWTEDVYGIPPEQVIGSNFVTQFELRDGQPVLMRMPKIDYIDDKAGKPVSINKFIGRRPILAFGNSDGDLQMLQWTAAGAGPRFMGLVHHTDGEREVAYDRKSHIGTLDKALDEANERGWQVVDMKQDWNVIFPPIKE